MSRRGRSGPTISLFSFQDIITSVTAIVTVITLLLALDLVQRKQFRSSNSSSAIAADFVDRLQAVESELDRLKSVANLTDDLIQEAAATSPAELQIEITQRESAVTQLQTEKARLEAQSNFWKTREREKLGDQFDLQPVTDEVAALNLQIAEVEKQRREEAADQRTIYALPRGFVKEGWIVAIEAKQITLAPIGRPEKPIQFRSDNVPLFGATSLSRLESWIDEHQSGTAYFLILIRPGAEDAFNDLQELMRRQKISYGFDVVDADRVLFHPERGAAP